ncbi:LysM peptidoglycan-binding domain-containing protein [Streptomyces sp. NPDC045431]|uniref:LysM peptidoglycan-binding domain-containing protein n=1 Tax=Streptomyces sp. NPDC045431 TaxID=3155613 RepID=UPI0033DEDBAB
MPAQGKHRRPKNNPLARRVAAAGTGGAALALPLFGATAAEAAPNAVPNAVPSAAVEKAPAKPATYTVVAGDTLSEIAADRGVSGGWKKLYEDNKSVVGDNPSLIRPGMKLTIGAKAKAKAAPAAPAAAERASRSTVRPALAKPATYANNLDGWIKEALAIMAERGIPGSYDGIHRNIMRESSGNPLAINNWDSNAAAGTPSKGLLQVIDPTFRAYHVPGTSTDPYDPVANITAACNYAADRYGSIDNVFGAY